MDGQILDTDANLTPFSRHGRCSEYKTQRWESEKILFAGELGGTLGRFS